MSGGAFLDTSVLVRLFDDDEPLRQAAARAVIGVVPGVDGPALVVSAQVLAEFADLVTTVIDEVVDLRLRENVQSSDLTIQMERRAEEGGSSDSPLVTMDGSIVGTPSYMAPEQAAGDLELTDQRSDVYSLGAILYVILTGQPPYLPPGAQISPRAIWARLIEDPPKPVYQVNPKAPPELMAVGEKAMAREPGDRYETSLDLAEDLQSFLDGRVGRAYRTGALTELGKWC